MATVHEIEQRLFSWAPRESAMDWDNVGHLVGDPEQEVERILVALDITERVVQEAIDCGAQLIVSHHPVMNVRWHEREMQTLRPDTRLGGVLSGKAGVINVHLGDGARCMELIERVISETEIPASQFLPTHVNRNEKLFQKAIEYAVKGGAVDFTGNEEIDYWETVCDEVRVCKGIRRMLDAGVNLQNVTTAIGFLMQRDVDQLEHVTIMCDGEDVHECTTSDQMIALLQSGKAVFGVSVGSLWHQIHDALETEDYVDLQSSSANVGSAGSGRVAGRPIDELTAMRMRRKIAAQRAAREAA